MKSADRSLAVLGAVVLMAIIAFAGLFVYSTNRALFSERYQIWISLQGADGLQEGDRVLYRGVQVGTVKKLAFTRDEGVLVRTVFTRRVPVTTEGTATLAAADMFGRQTLVLEPGLGGRELAAGDTLIGGKRPSLTGRIEGMASRLERAVGDSTVDAIHRLLGESAAAASALESAMRTMQASMQTQVLPLHETLTAAAAIAANLRAATDSTRLVGARDHASSTFERLDHATARLDTASSMIVRALERIEGGQGSLGRLTTDAELYERAVAALSGVELLITDVRMNPKRYIPSVKVF